MIPVRAVSASEQAVRGWSADALLVDEAQLVPDGLLLAAALPTIAARPGAFALLAGTCGRAEGAFYDTCRRGEVGEEGVRYSRGGGDVGQMLTLIGRVQAAPLMRLPDVLVPLAEEAGMVTTVEVGATIPGTSDDRAARST